MSVFLKLSAQLLSGMFLLASGLLSGCATPPVNSSTATPVTHLNLMNSRNLESSPRPDQQLREANLQHLQFQITNLDTQISNLDAMISGVQMRLQAYQAWQNPTNEPLESLARAELMSLEAQKSSALLHRQQLQSQLSTVQ